MNRHAYLGEGGLELMDIDIVVRAAKQEDLDEVQNPCMMR